MSKRKMMLFCLLAFSIFLTQFLSFDQSFATQVKQSSSTTDCGCNSSNQNKNLENTPVIKDKKNLVSSTVVSDLIKTKDALNKIKTDKLFNKVSEYNELSKYKLDLSNVTVREIDISNLEMKNNIANTNTNTDTNVKVPMNLSQGDGQLSYTYTDKYSVAQFSIKIKGEEIEKRKGELFSQQTYKKLVDIITNQKLKVDKSSTIGLKSVTFSSVSDDIDVNTGVVIPVVDENKNVVGQILKFDSNNIPILKIGNEITAFKDGEVVTFAEGDSCSLYVGCVIKCFCNGGAYDGLRA